MSDAKWVIEPMTDSDLHQVMPLEIDSFPDPWAPVAFLAELEHNPRARYRALKVAGELEGYIGWWRTAFGVDVLKLCVSPKMRRQGAGAALVGEALADLGKGQIARVLVRRGNAAARALYERCGFEERGIYEAYYTAPTEDAIVLTRSS